jgi:hypothetical protein
MSDLTMSAAGAGIYRRRQLANILGLTFSAVSVVIGSALLAKRLQSGRTA